MFHTPRKLGERDGGVGLMFKTSLDLRSVTKDVVASNFSAFEHCEYLFKSIIWVRLVVVYRPPPSAAKWFNCCTIQQGLLNIFGVFSATTE